MQLGHLAVAVVVIEVGCDKLHAQFVHENDVEFVNETNLADKDCCGIKEVIESLCCWKRKTIFCCCDDGAGNGSEVVGGIKVFDLYICNYVRSVVCDFVDSVSPEC